ncbi:uncharacterized protein B0P05DRAFT_528202 [Gilbertella persicaria]|uniref:uncharacterized protein n=1 Tax=Gilbertella persicaria TaxID=101096 RepID=UPI00221E48D2|nr:uncharacterized protein B0P05DRAFT_528202 [Gilbertella persicaria]KAI8090965.1 hypothetical protein B0P05DRAFT_528202 [Gilbertella persicaria]
MKRSVIKRRKRIIVAQGSDEEGMEEDDDSYSTQSTPPPPPSSSSSIAPQTTVASSSLSSSSSSMANMMQSDRPVPEIEDYVVLKKKRVTTDSPILSDKILNPLLSKPYSDQQQSFLPPISSERQSYRLESLFGRQESNQLPSLSLPPLTPPSSQQPKQMMVQPSPPPPPPAPAPVPTTKPQPKTYELADFDHALDRLEHLRRQVRPEQAYALSQLTHSLTDLASKAEAILSLDSLAYGR